MRVYAVAIVLAGLAPALFLVGFLAIGSARIERSHLEHSAKNQTRKAIAAIEREIVSITNLLHALADSPSLKNEDLESFYGQAANVAREVGVAVILRSAQTETLVLNTRVPWGVSLAAKEHDPRSEYEKARLRAGQTIITGVFYGRVLNKYFVAVVIPVFRDGVLRFYLSAGVPVKRFGEILNGLDIRPNQTVSIIDRNQVYVARSVDQDKYAGTVAAVPVPFTDAPGVLAGRTRTGFAFHAFHRLSEPLDWAVSTSVPDRVLEAPMHRAVAGLVAAGGSLSIIAVMLALAWGERLARSMGALGIDRKPTREEFEALFNSSPNGVLVVDSQGRIALLNAQVRADFGYATEELVGKPVEVLVPERFRQSHLKLRHALALKPYLRSVEAERGLYARRKDGSEFPVEVGLNPINSGAEKLVMITVVDISVRQRAAEQLAAANADRDRLRRRFIDAQEQERLRLARELHDQTGQGLTAVMLRIKAMESSVAEAERPSLRLLRMELEQVGRTLHHVAWELRPASIDELGLASALGNYVAEWSAQTKIEADFYCDDSGIDALSDEKSTTIYRVVQEALTNVAKHARQASSVSVVIERAGAQLRLTIEDDGSGFEADPQTLLRGGRDGGLGLAGMRERLTLIGAEFEVESSPGVGTTIFARIPLESARSAA